MGFKALMTALAIVLALAIYGIGGAEKVSVQFENYYNEKMTEPDIEKYTIYNINYTHFTGKYERTLELCNKFLEKYPESYKLKEREANRDRVSYIRAKSYDNMINIQQTKNFYSLYLEEFPEGKYADKVKERLRDFQIYK